MGRTAPRYIYAWFGRLQVRQQAIGPRCSRSKDIVPVAATSPSASTRYTAHTGSRAPITQPPQSQIVCVSLRLLTDPSLIPVAAEKVSDTANGNHTCMSSLAVTSPHPASRFPRHRRVVAARGCVPSARLSSSERAAAPCRVLKSRCYKIPHTRAIPLYDHASFLA